MRYATSLSQTHRLPAGASPSTGLDLLEQAGYLQSLPGGLTILLPLGQVLLARLKHLLLTSWGEVFPEPVAIPPLLSENTLPDRLAADSITRLQGGFPHLLSSETLPALFSLLPSVLRSYRQLPLSLYRLDWQWRSRRALHGGTPRGQLERVLEVFTLHASAASLEQQAAAVEARLLDTFQHLQLPLQPIESLPGPFGLQARRWLVPHPDGNTSALTCSGCSYAASLDATDFQTGPFAEAPLSLEKVATPHCTTIEDLAAFLQVPASRTAKAVFFMAILPRGRQEFLFAVVRGDRQLNEERLKQVSGALDLRPASEEEIRRAGAEPGYASPVGLKNVWVIVDEEASRSPNLVSGANDPGFHLLNVNYGRDYTASRVEHIALARPGDVCPRCGSLLQPQTGSIAGASLHVNPLVSGKTGCTFVDVSGRPQPAHILHHHFSLVELAACLAQQHHDLRGLCWPASLAPLQVHLVELKGKEEQGSPAAAALVASLQSVGLEPLHDDRSESPGVKFNDADLIGLPLRITLSERSLRQGGVELKLRRGEQVTVMPLEECAAAARRLLADEEPA